MKFNIHTNEKTDRVKSVSFHPTLPHILIALHTGQLLIYDTSLRLLIDELPAHAGSVRCCTFHPRFSIFATCGDDQIIKIWDYATKNVTSILKGHTDYVRSVDFHPTQPFLLSCSDDQTVKVWNFQTGKQVGNLIGHLHYVMDCKFFNEKYILTASLDHTIRMWDYTNIHRKTGFLSLQNIVLQQVIEGHERGVNKIFILNEKSENLMDFKNVQFGSCSDDREVKIWELRGDVASEVTSVGTHQGCVTAGCFVEKTAISVGEDGIISYGNSGRFKIDSRFWCIAQKGNFIVAGHDNGFFVFNIHPVNPVFAFEKSLVYFREGKVYENDLKTEKMLFSTKRVPVKMEKMKKRGLIVNYPGSFEIYENRSLNHSGVGEAFFVKDGYAIKDENAKDENLIVKKEGKIYKIGKFENVFSSKNFLFGWKSGILFVIKNCEIVASFSSFKPECCYVNDNESSFGVDVKNDLSKSDSSKSNSSKSDISDKKKRGSDKKINEFDIDKNIDEFDIDKNIDEFDIDKKINEFDIDKNVKDGKTMYKTKNTTNELLFLVVRSEREISVYDKKFNLINYKKEVMPIISGFIDGGNFIYSTTGQIKYIGVDCGILKSEENCAVFAKDGRKIYVLKNEVVCLEVDDTEMIFKAAVRNNDPITQKIIESGELPGLAPVQFLLKSAQSLFALQYLTDPVQKFYLLISNKMFKEALLLARTPQMYDKLAEESLKNCEIEVAEKCFEATKDFHNLFLLFLCSKNYEKMKMLVKKCRNVDLVGIGKFLEADGFVEKVFKAGVVGIGSLRMIRNEFVGDDKKNNCGNENKVEISGNKELGIDDVKNKNKDIKNKSNDVKTTSDVKNKNNDVKTTSDVKNKSKDVKTTSDIKNNDVKTTSDVKKNDKSKTTNKSDNNDKSSNDKNVGATEDVNELIKINETIWCFINGKIDCEKVFEEASKYLENGNVKESIKLYKEIFYSKFYDCEIRKRVLPYLISTTLEEIKRETEKMSRKVAISRFLCKKRFKFPHRHLFVKSAVATFIECGNYKDALAFGGSAELCKNKENVFEDKGGVFCFDLLEFGSGGVCGICGVGSRNLGKCKLCLVGDVN